MKISPVENMYWDRMQQIEKGECENSFFTDLCADGNLPLLLIHALISQAAEQNLVGGIVRVDSNADASGDGKGVAVDIHGLAQGAGDAGNTRLGDQLCRAVARQ